jgi:DNA-binding response OmpR family regulator
MPVTDQVRAAPPSILLLEDDAELRDLLVDVLTGEGYRVQHCASPEDVMRASDADAGALAIVDAWGDSHQTLSDEEREQIGDLARSVPTLMLTGRTWSQGLRPAELGLVGLVTKPFDLDEVLGIVKRSVDNLHAEPEQARSRAHDMRRGVPRAQERLLQA